MRALPQSSVFLELSMGKILVFRYTASNRTEDRATLESDPSADPAAGIGAGAQLPPIRFGVEFRSQSWPEGAKLRGLGRSPSNLGLAHGPSLDPTPPILSSKLLLPSVSSTSHLSALTASMSVFAPGVAITHTASKGQTTFRAYPFLDEDPTAACGCRYFSRLRRIHQLDSARCLATATAALPWHFFAFTRSYSCKA